MSHTINKEHVDTYLYLLAFIFILVLFLNSKGSSVNPITSTFPIHLADRSGSHPKINSNLCSNVYLKVTPWFGQSLSAQQAMAFEAWNGHL